MPSMTALALFGLFIVAQPAASYPQNAGSAQREFTEVSDLMSALQAAQIAEIYVINPSISYTAAPTPDVVRRDGCKYFVRRAHYLGDSPQWRDLEQTLAKADLRFISATTRAELRLGLLLSDWQGALWETYAETLVRPNGRMRGLDRRRSVEISASFVSALRDFVARHPELAQSSPEHCSPSEAP